MTNQQFLFQLIIITGLCAVGLWGLMEGVPDLRAYQALGWISLVGFTALSGLMFWAGRKAALSKNKNDFTSAVLGFTMGKMFLAVIIIYAYMKLAQPADKLFVIPFFGVYVVYTVFETYFMMKLGRTGV